MTFGGPASFNSVVSLEGNVEDANIEMDRSGAYIISPLTKARRKTIPLAVNFPKYLYEDGRSDLEPQAQLTAMGKPGNVNGYRAFCSKTMDTNVVGQVLFGKFSEMLVGQWSGVDMVTDPYSLADYGQIRIIIDILTDVAFRHALAFAASTDSGAQ